MIDNDKAATAEEFVQSTKQPVQQQQPGTITVRESIAILARMEDLDGELCFSFHNSDPIPITDITDNGDGQVVVS